MSTILDRYIRRLISLNTSMVFLCLVFLSSMVRLIDTLRNISDKNISVFAIFSYTFLSLPKDFEFFFPISILLGGLLGLSMLDMRNELIIMQVFGLSKFKIALSVIKAAVPILLLCNIISNEWLLPYTQKMMFFFRNDFQYNTYLFPEKNKNLWLIDNNNFIFIKKMESVDKLLEVNLYVFTKDRKLKEILYIEEAIYKNKNWIFLNIRKLEFFDEIRVSSQYIENSEWNTILTPKILHFLVINPRVLSISKLLFCMNYFKLVGQNSRYYELIFWNKIFSPIIGVLMVITALSCSFGPLYHTKINIRLLFGSIVSFLFYVIYQIFGTFSIYYDIMPLVGSIAPIFLLLIINMIIMWKFV